MADEQKASEEQKPTLQTASDRIRETAKWLVLALAALGGVLTAGMQLSSLGSLPPSSPRWTAAVWGGIAAVAGAGLILGLAVWVATTPLTTFATVVAKAGRGDLRPELEDPILLQEFSSVKDLYNHLHDAVHALSATAAERLELAVNGTPDAAPNAPANAAINEANVRVGLQDEELGRLYSIARDVTDMASYYRLTWRWNLASVGIALGGLATVVGVTFFIWAINPPADAKASAASPAVLSAVSSGTLTLTPAGKAAITSSEDPACARKPTLSVLVLGDTQSGPDILVQEPGCSPARLVLGSDWGTLSKKP